MSCADLRMKRIRRVYLAEELKKTKAMGCRSYAEFAIRPNMAASVDVVMSFLNDLSDTVRHKAYEVFKGVNLILAYIIG